MRGKESKRSGTTSRHRITPAYAGKSTGGGLDGTFYKDHPRLCGEKSDRCQSHMWKTGSPPPMRGKGFSAFEFYVDFGITPAYAGKSMVIIP